MRWWRRERDRPRWPTATPPTVPPGGPPEFDCRQCGHPEAVHPTPGSTTLFACAVCLWEEDHDQRDDDQICRELRS